MNLSSLEEVMHILNVEEKGHFKSPLELIF